LLLSLDRRRRLSIIMSGELEAAATDVACCASCGKAEVDTVKLKKCACKLVRYCGVDCQKNHRLQHKEACKKRLAEIRDDELFKQPDESYLGECPICCLPTPLDLLKKSLVNSCCCKRICRGCDYANKNREIKQGMEHKCPFCREPLPKTDEESIQNYMKRAKANDPIALFNMGKKCYEEGDYEGAFQYYTKAAALGNAMAHYNLSCMFYYGKGVEKDLKKRKFTISKRLPSVVNLTQGTILENTRMKMEGMIEQ